MKDARLKPYRASKGPGCKRLWYEVHTDGWICGDFVQPSELPPGGLKYPVVAAGELTPWPYAFVREPTIEYAIKNGEVTELRDILKGFGFGVEGNVEISGTKYFKTAEGTLVPKRAAVIAGRISKLGGVEIKDGTLWPLGFVSGRNTWAHNTPSRSKQTRIGKVERYTPFQLRGLSGRGKSLYYRFDDAGWLAAEDVRIVSEAPPPDGITADEKWIDIDTSQQIITAYTGRTPVFATLVSTGRFGPSQTVKGEYRIWAKVAAIAMDNTDEDLDELETATTNEAAVDAGAEVERKLYSLHDVPWTQFFFESFALHGVYWHDRFGNRRSHGCVNLSPADARWLYDWTEPRVPEGWWAVHTGPNEKGTLVRVR
jgi:lipoprotein-anchoring transpeptidase ErfK/SrfK